MRVDRSRQCSSAEQKRSFVIFLREPLSPNKMRSLYSKYMFDWETRMTTRDANRVVRPFEWGLEWTEDWPVSARNGDGIPADDFAAEEKYVRELNRHILKHSDEFFGYKQPTDFRLTTRVIPGERGKSSFLQFTSPVVTPFPVNNTVSARWFP